jgi:hypothetical protein
LRGVVVHKPSGALRLADNRIKSAVRMLRRAEIAQATVRLVSETIKKRSRKPRFAYASLARQQRYLAFAGLRF